MSDKKDTTVPIATYVNSEERDAIESAAKKVHRSMSSFIKTATLEKAEKVLSAKSLVA